MGKTVIRIICFVLIFTGLWTAAGFVLNHDWNIREYLPERYADLEQEKNLDIIMLGGSNVYSAVAPSVIWHEAGITSFNLGDPASCNMIFYYQLKYVLKHHLPSLVILDMAGLSTEKDPVSAEAAFRRAYATMPDVEIQKQLLDDMYAHWPHTDRMAYLFPLLRYHERWDKLSEEDFNAKEREDHYKSYSKGCRFSLSVREFAMPEDLFRSDREQVMDVNMEYLEKIYSLCANNGIELLLLFCPRMELYDVDYVAAKEFSKEKGIRFLAFPTASELEGLGISATQDFLDTRHLNIRGQKKFSEYLAGYLAIHYTFGSHENDQELCDDWNKAYRRYKKFYKTHCDSLKHSG